MGTSPGQPGFNGGRLLPWICPRCRRLVVLRQVTTGRDSVTDSVEGLYSGECGPCQVEFEYVKTGAYEEYPMHLPTGDDDDEFREYFGDG